ncbi:hypothetical protein F1C16_21375 (plasmid) [Hymenobacter sp. NBH84]|uniref:hypothetical protein n=1 Tax=Hymenobacter sp. NBH84 TaxID=2596915 RepID=UPI001629DC68|nr:hypothetical protein [Hymenobacter sp. NBH84]QNE42180.1 hypothetical protein F1C16_21375 [Hymenobacter sp. NBH84]
MNRDLIGKRLAQLRDELAAPGEAKWSQVRLANELGLTQNVVARLEKSAAGSNESLLTLLLFYHQRGFNITWILLDDNSHVSRMRLDETTPTLDKRSVLEKLAGLRETVDSEVVKLMETIAD